MNITWTVNEVTVSWYRPVSVRITNIIINYTINEESGSVKLINNDTTRHWSHNVTNGDKYEYLISIAAGIYTNNTLINGNYTNLTGTYKPLLISPSLTLPLFFIVLNFFSAWFLGCHGNCDTTIHTSIPLYILIGGAGGVCLAIIIIIIIFIIIAVTLRKR